MMKAVFYTLLTVLLIYLALKYFGVDIVRFGITYVKGFFG